MVTLISQDLSEFALHVRAILELPIPNIRQFGAAAACAILAEGDSKAVIYGDLDRALAEPNSTIRLFGKPNVSGRRRMGVALALGNTLEEARAKAGKVANAVQVNL
jgi:phosphoribosylglycinamide formyltransferase 2